MMLLAQSGGDSGNGDLATLVGDEIQVALDRWSVGQLDVGDLAVAGSIVVVGAVLAWAARRISKRTAHRTSGAARTATETAGLLVASSLLLLAGALALEVLGFSLGPILILVLVAVVALLLLRPLITNLSTGLLLQVRGAIETGDLVRTNGMLGVVDEINARSVVLDTSDGRRVHVPNSNVLNDTIENYSTRGRRRSSFDVIVGCDADLDGVATIIVDALAPVEAVLADPEPEVAVVGIAGRLIVVRVFVWHEPATATQRAAIDGAVRATLHAVRAGGHELDGPEWMALDTPAAGATGVTSRG